MGDITPLKILIVAVIALLVLGPERLPEMTRKAGKAWADFKSFRANLESQVRETVGDVPGFNELSKLSKLSNAGIKSTIASSVSSAMSMPTGAGPTSAGPTSAGPTSAGGASAGPTSAGGASAEPTSAEPTLASVSSGSQVSVAATPVENGSHAGGSPVGASPLGANGDGWPRPDPTRVPGAPRVSSGEPAFAADDPSFN